MKILIVNAGSSSLKYQLVDMQDESVLAKGLVERIGIPGSKLTQKYHRQRQKICDRNGHAHTMWKRARTCSPP